MEDDNTKKYRKLSKRRKALVIFLTIFLILFSAITIFGYFFLDPLLAKQIKKSVHKSSGGQYSLIIGDLKSDIWTGNVYLKDLALVQDTVVLRKLQAKNPGENFPFITLSAGSASISNFRWLNYIIDRDLKVGTIVINEPNLKVLGEDPSESLRSTNKNFIELLPAIIAGFAGSLRIEELIVNSGKINYKAFDDDGLIAQQAEDIFIDITEINIDTVSTERLLYSEDIAFRLKDYRLTNPKRDQIITIAEMEASLSDSTFVIAKFQMQQNSGKKSEINETDLSIKAIKGIGVDFKSFLYGKQILMDRIQFEKPSIYLATKESKKNSEQEKKEMTGKIKIPDILSGMLQSFTINEIAVRDGIVDNIITTNQGNTHQFAKNVNIDIVRVEGKTQDTLQLVTPEEVTIRFTDYELKSTNPSINLKINSFEGSTATGALHLNNVAIRYQEQRDNGSAVAVSSTIHSAGGTGFDLKTVVDQQKVLLKTFVINSPTIHITSKGKGTSTEASGLNRVFAQGIPEPLAEFIKSFEIDKSSIQNGSFTYTESEVNNPVTQRMGKINTEVIKLYTGSPNDPINFKSIAISIFDYSLQVGKENFSLEVPKATFVSSTKNAVLQNIKIVQDHPPDKEANHYTVTIPTIRSTCFDVKKAIREGKFTANKVDVTQMRGEFLMHKIRPEYAEKMPNELVRDVEFYFRFDTVIFHKAYISHADATGDFTTLISFENSEGRLLNLTNDKELMNPVTPAIFSFTTRLMGKGRLSASVRVPLSTPSFNGSYNGSFSGMDGKAFNTILRNEGFQIESGVIDSAFFDIGIRNGISNGRLGFLYHNADIEVLDKQDQKSRLKSLLGNFIIKNSNPKDSGDEPEIVAVDASRDEHDSFFYFLWRPILEGILKTVTKGSLLPDGFTEK